jgi:hypothetical protein
MQIHVDYLYFIDINSFCLIMEYLKGPSHDIVENVFIII